MRIYANLIGNWTDITDTGTVFSGHNPVKYFREELLDYANNSKTSKLFEYDYINIEYNGHVYRIHPTQIQIIDCD